jgi:glucosamine-6-phosphate deaminase
MGIKTILSAKSILLLVNGEKKADIIMRVIFGDITPQIPGSALQFHSNVTVLTDRAAGALLLKDL